jgi:hypothetical protein
LAHKGHISRTTERKLLSRLLIYNEFEWLVLGRAAAKKILIIRKKNLKFQNISLTFSIIQKFSKFWVLFAKIPKKPENPQKWLKNLEILKNPQKPKNLEKSSHKSSRIPIFPMWPGCPNSKTFSHNTKKNPKIHQYSQTSTKFRKNTEISIFRYHSQYSKNSVKFWCSQKVKKL